MHKYYFTVPEDFESSYSCDKVASAVQGSIKSSSLQETKAAASLIKRCIDSMVQIETLSREGNYDAIGKILASADFQNIESAATVLVRSDLLTADEKVSLGTIKRYGIVADALIMIGGLNAELKAGGIDYFPKAASLQKSIEDEGDMEEEEETKAVVVINASEVRRYVALAKGSLQDIFKIVEPILNK